MGAQQADLENKLWQQIHTEVWDLAKGEPMLASFYHATILNHESLASALSFHLANKLDSPTVPAMAVREIIDHAINADDGIIHAVCEDIVAVKSRDPACHLISMPLLYFKGFHALQAYRVTHWLWHQDRRTLAVFLQNQISVALGVDIHPAAKIGSGILIDHATGLVVGETAVVEDNVSLMQNVTLGGTGNEEGDRHPKVRHGVLVGAGAIVLGNVEIGIGAKIGAGSVVLTAVPAHTTVAGVPAKVVGKPASEQPALNMDHQLNRNE